MRPDRLSLALVLALAASAGCQLRPPARIPDCAGSLVSTLDLAGDWLIHERIRVRGDRVDEAYGLVAQKTGDRLVLVGLTPFGATAFTLSQVGLAVESDSRLGRALPVPPENVLRDFHRAHFIAIDGAELENRRVRRDADGVVHVTSVACGYEATLAPVRAGGTAGKR